MTRSDKVANQIFGLDLVEDKWRTNVVILSYLKPRGFNQSYSTFLFKLNSALYNELEEQTIDANKLNTLVVLLRKFSTNVFKSQNEELIRQVGRLYREILDINLVKMLVRVLRLPRKTEHRKIDLKEVLSMLSLFVIDDSIVEYFLSANLASDLFFYLKEDRIDKKSGVVNLVTIMIHLFRLKSYSFSKSLKIDFLVFVFRHYEKTEEEEFKTDLLQLLCSVYQIKEFKKLLHDEEVLIELKYRTDIVEIEELIVNELQDERRVLERAREVEIAQGKHRPRKKPDHDWVEQFTLYSYDPLANVTILHQNMMDQIQQDEIAKMQQEENEGVLIDTKTKSIISFLNELKTRGPNSFTTEKAKKAADELQDIKELIMIQHENIFYQAKSRMTDLKKENETLKQLIQQYGLRAPSTSGDLEPEPPKMNSGESTRLETRIQENKPGIGVNFGLSGGNGLASSKLPSLSSRRFA